MAILEAPSEAVAAAGAALRDGALVAFPTETVYGLGADACNGRAVGAIFAAKGRPRFNPLIVHVADIDAVARLGRLTDGGRRLAEALWPGALSLVMAKQPGARWRTWRPRASTPSRQGARAPVAQALLRAADRPIAAPSANRSGHVSPTTAAHVEADLGPASRSFSTGAGADRAGSTVVDVIGEEPVILRLGGLAREHRGASAGRSPGPGRAGSPPRRACWRGTMRLTRLRLDARGARREALLAFGHAVPRHEGAMINLSPPATS
jgi:L-threonylcarbamoyladenylate synthase